MKNPSEQALVASKLFSDWIGTYIPSIQAASPHSIRSYKTSVAMFISYLGNELGITPANFSAGCISADSISGWILWMKDSKKCSPSTCNARLSALRSFLRYLSSRDIMFLTSYLQSRSIHQQKTTRKKVSGVSLDGIRALLEQPKLNTDKGLRDYSIILTLYSCALRVSELLSLKIADIKMNIAKPYLSVVGKGRKIRTIPLLTKPLRLLRQYVDNHPGKDNGDSYLFYSRTKGIDKPMTQRNVDKILKGYARIAHGVCADVPICLHAHQLRHAKASHWLGNGMNIAQISHLLGHDSINTTMVYLDITTEQESAALATLEDSVQKNAEKKWAGHKNSDLLTLFGIRQQPNV